MNPKTQKFVPNHPLSPLEPMSRTVGLSKEAQMARAEAIDAAIARTELQAHLRRQLARDKRRRARAELKQLKRDNLKIQICYLREHGLHPDVARSVANQAIQLVREYGPQEAEAAAACEKVIKALVRGMSDVTAKTAERDGILTAERDAAIRERDTAREMLQEARAQATGATTGVGSAAPVGAPAAAAAATRTGG